MAKRGSCRIGHELFKFPALLRPDETIGVQGESVDRRATFTLYQWLGALKTEGSPDAPHGLPGTRAKGDEQRITGSSCRNKLLTFCKLMPAIEAYLKQDIDELTTMEDALRGLAAALSGRGPDSISGNFAQLNAPPGRESSTLRT